MVARPKVVPKGVFGRVYQDGLVRWPWHGRLESGSNGTGARVWQVGPGARLHRDRVWQLLVQIDTVTLASDMVALSPFHFLGTFHRTLPGCSVPMAVTKLELAPLEGVPRLAEAMLLYYLMRSRTCARGTS
jgi:hypothetical protein